MCIFFPRINSLQKQIKIRGVLNIAFRVTTSLHLLSGSKVIFGGGKKKRPLILPFMTRECIFISSTVCAGDQILLMHTQAQLVTSAGHEVEVNSINY